MLTRTKTITQLRIIFEIKVIYNITELKAKLTNDTMINLFLMENVNLKIMFYFPY